MVSFALHGPAELRWDGKRGHTTGAIGPALGAGDVGFAGGFEILLLIGPVVALEREAASLLDGAGFIGALPIDRNAIGSFDGEERQGDLLEMRKPGAKAGLLGGRLGE